jgi:hypothetical protein
MYKPAGSPVCFGTKLWSPVAVECVGGMDPAYTNPINQSHKRERCGWYSQCATASTSASVNTPSPSAAVAPVTVQPSQVLVPPPPTPAQSHPWIQQYGRPPVPSIPSYQNPYVNPYQTPYAQMAPQQLLPPWIAQFGPQLVPVIFQQPGAQIGAYLTVPEPVDPNEGWLWRLVREIIRSMFKSSGHTAASFFDHNPWRPYHAPELPALPAPPVQPIKS